MYKFKGREGDDVRQGKAHAVLKKDMLNHTAPIDFDTIDFIPFNVLYLGALCIPVNVVCFRCMTCDQSIRPVV